MSNELELYHVTGKYCFNNCWNDIPKDCQYFYASPNRKATVLKGLIAKHRSLSAQTNYSLFVKLGGLQWTKLEKPYCKN